MPTEKFLMVNPRRGEVEEILGRLGGDEVDVSPAEGPWPLAPEGLLVASGSLAAAEQLAELGEITILSRGSAAVVEVLGPEEGERVLDLCSGPGIKTGRIAASVGHYGNVVAVEPESARADDVAAQLDRLGYHNTLVVEGDGRAAEILSDFDRVLVDAPCSDLGALASRPDARWRKNPSVIARLLDLQSELLDRAGDLVRPGGTVVYSTCTISRRENADQAIAFAERSGLEPDDLGALAPDLADPTDSRFIQLFPDRDSTTGFFIARFSKPLVPEVGQ
jgi:16S rRNA (cytosine967-C5)-methyltransferase